MSNTYTWTITGLDCYPQAEGQTDVVFLALWRCTASNGASTPVTVTIVGNQALTYTAGTPFTPYNELTQSQVLGWVQTAMGPTEIAAIQSNLDSQIDIQVNSPVTQPPLPWAQA